MSAVSLRDARQASVETVSRETSGPVALTPEGFAAQTGASPDIVARLKAYAGLLEAWNARHNLVAASTLPELWHRHMLDSAQLLPLIPDSAQSLVDLGSGAGFPGLVLACLLRGRPGFRTVLYESIGKKCTFLREAAACMEVDVEVRQARMEAARPEPFDAVSARACAPLDMLLTYALPFQGPRTINLFLKGQSAADELTAARESWKINVVRQPSVTAPSAAILVIREIRHAGTDRRRPRRRSGP